MRYELEALRHGFDASADVIVVGSGPGGGVAAANLARAGMKVVLLEAGPEVTPTDMTRDAPRFLARHAWEGGLRAIGGRARVPTLQARCLGGGSVLGGAVMTRLPDWVRRLWIEEDGVDWLRTDALDQAYARVFARLRVRETDRALLGRRSTLLEQAFAAAGLPGAPPARAVVDCVGAGDCATGCFDTRKQTIDRTHVADAEHYGASVYTSAQVERILMHSGRAVGVSGHVVDPDGHASLATFVVRAPRVVLSAGAAQTPALLAYNGLTAHGAVGASLGCHVGFDVFGCFDDEPVEPWVGATSGWSASCPEVPGLELESTWGPLGLVAARFGGLGLELYDALARLGHTTRVGLSYRARMTGAVRPRADGAPRLTVDVPDGEVTAILRGARRVVDALFDVGASAVHLGLAGAPTFARTRAEAHALLDRRWRFAQLETYAHHVFGSCPMSSDLERGAVDPSGRLRDVEGVWVADASVFPSASATHPQATIMAMADVITRRLGELPLDAPPG
jgi:choline dehydrogenase-like flavoprotein